MVEEFEGFAPACIRSRLTTWPSVGDDDVIRGGSFRFFSQFVEVV
jgi:hypothetical protein